MSIEHTEKTSTESEREIPLLPREMPALMGEAAEMIEQAQARPDLFSIKIERHGRKISKIRIHQTGTNTLCYYADLEAMESATKKETLH